MQCMSHRNEWDLSNSSILNFSTKESQFSSFTFFPLPQVFLLWFPALMTWILDSFNLLSSFHHRLYVNLTATIVFLLMMILLLPWFAPHFLFFWLFWLLLPISTAPIGHTFRFSTQRHCFISFSLYRTLLQHPCLHTIGSGYTNAQVISSVLFRSSWPHGICLDFQLWIQCHSVVIFMFHYFDIKYSSLCYIQ